MGTGGVIDHTARSISIPPIFTLRISFIMLRPVLPAAFLLLCTAAATAQISFGGRAIGLMEQGPHLPAPAKVVLPAVDAAALIAEDEARAAQGIKGPYRFGYNHATDLSLDNSGTWHALRNGDRVWRLAIECPAAHSINLEFHEYVVPEGGRVFVYNDMGDQLGAFTAESAAGRHTLGITLLPGSRITIEYHEPHAASGLGRLRVGQVTHGYRDVFNMRKDFGDSGSCNINVICPEGDNWRDQIRSVTRIVVGGAGFCTGTLINNCALDSTPYILTADHCLNANIESSIFLFNWDSPDCDPTANAPMDQTVSGCQLLVNSAGTDVALLQMNSIPPADYQVYYSGWDKTDVPATSVVGIHHPAGDIKKISRSDGAVIQGTMSGADCWQVQVWNAGTTEPGSSGSGLWNQNRHLVGQLFGGQANCANSVNDFYGRLDVSWPLLEPYLGACGDTLTGWEPGTVIIEPDTNDAAVTSITGIPPLVCNTSTIAPVITLKNNGTGILYSAIITYGVVGGTPEVFVWNGVLHQGQTVNVDLPAITVAPGEQVLEVTCSSPNGEPDNVMGNDTWTHPFTVSYPGETISLLLTHDNWGSDVTWTLATTTGTVLYAGGPYPDLNAGHTDTALFCLSNACYVFTIIDEFGDGICCEEGDGSYRIQDNHGTTYAESDGQYTTQNVNEFCVTAVGVEEPGLRAPFHVWPNPTTGMLSVDMSGNEGTAHLHVTDGLGRSVRQRTVNGRGTVQLDLGGLADGLYLLEVRTAGHRSTQRVVLSR